MKSVPKWSYDNKLYLKDFNRRLEVIFFALKVPSLYLYNHTYTHHIMYAKIYIIHGTMQVYE